MKTVQLNRQPTYFAVPIGPAVVRVCENRPEGYEIVCELPRSPDLINQLHKRGIPRKDAITIAYDLQRVHLRAA